MWYFSWILGVGLASAFGILNALWYEFRVAGPAGTTSRAELGGELFSREQDVSTRR